MVVQLSTNIVISEGVRLVAERGWEELSVRALAGRLSVTPMALYRHVADREALMRQVLDTICAGLPSVADTGDVERDLRDWARAAHKHVRAYPGVAGHLMVSWFEVSAVLDRVDGLLKVVGRHGLKGFDAVAVTNAVFTYVLMRAQAEQQVQSAGAVTRHVAAGAPLAHLAAVVQHYTTAELDLHFEFGLEALLVGALQKVQR